MAIWRFAARGAAVSAMAAAAFVAGAAARRAATPEKIDCHGGEVTISGENRTVEVANCRLVRVTGSHDEVEGVLARHAKVVVTGDDNTLRLRPPQGTSFSRLKDTGRGNTFHGPGPGPQG